MLKCLKSILFSLVLSVFSNSNGAAARCPAIKTAFDSAFCILLIEKNNKEAGCMSRDYFIKKNVLPGEGCELYEYDPIRDYYKKGFINGIGSCAMCHKTTHYKSEPIFCYTCFPELSKK